jgi:hypothetical protein
MSESTAHARPAQAVIAYAAMQHLGMCRRSTGKNTAKNRMPAILTPSNT